MSILYFPKAELKGHRVRCLTESYKILTNQTWHAKSLQTFDFQL